jgi:TolB-like protein
MTTLHSARALAGTALLALAAHSGPSRTPQVAVMPLSAHAIDSTSVSTIEDALGTELLRTGKVRVLERSQMNAILKEQGFQQAACDKTDCTVEVGKLLSVDRLVVGSIGHLGNTYSMTLRLVDVSTGEVVGSTTRNQAGAIDGVLTQLLPLAVGDLFQDGAGPALLSTTPTPASATAKPTETASSGHSLWPWVAGGVVVAGGATAAVLLLQGKSGSGTATAASGGTPSTSTSTVTMTVP